MPPNCPWGDNDVDSTDFETCFQLALAKAFHANDNRVRIAYFDLAQFYYQRVRHLRPMFPPSGVMSEVLAKVAA